MNRTQRKRRAKGIAASDKRAKRLKPYDYRPGRSARIDELVSEVEANGWTVRFQPYCEDTETPGWLGRYAGVCLHKQQIIKIKLVGQTEAHIIAILEHEMEHMRGERWGTDHPLLGLHCGGRITGMGESER